ncbi:methyltransferase domain-containing protein [bacterium]|nr:methyltransferase domain-containing protein [bacterium]
MLKDIQDAFGHEIFDYYKDKSGFEIVERDDGYIDISYGPQHYFLEYKGWPTSEKMAMKHVSGRVLDVGCGAGRHSLYLQSKGFNVAGIDSSPLAITVCRKRGMRDARIIPITRLNHRVGIFDTIIMMGNNFALLGKPKRVKWMMRRFYNMTTDGGKIIAQVRDPYQTDVPEHLAYHAQNRKKGNLSGEARIRVRYKKYVTPWIDFLMVSLNEMKQILEGTRWQVQGVIDGEGGEYIIILEKLINS